MTTIILELSIKVEKEPVDGKFRYHILFYRYFKDVRPRLPHWDVVKSGTYLECLSHIISCAALCDLGHIESRDGRFDPIALIKMFRIAMQRPLVPCHLDSTNRPGISVLAHASVSTSLIDCKLPFDFLILQFQTAGGYYYFLRANGMYAFGNYGKVSEWFILKVVHDQELSISTGAAESIIEKFQTAVGVSTPILDPFIIDVHFTDGYRQPFLNDLAEENILDGNFLKVDLVKSAGRIPILLTSIHFILPTETLNVIDEINKKNISAKQICSDDPWSSFDIDDDDDFSLAVRPAEIPKACSLSSAECDACQ